MAASIGFCAFATTQNAVVVLMALAYFGKGIGALGWAVGSDTSPKEAAGISGALLNTFANVAGITTPVGVGHIVEWTRSFDWAPLYVAANATAAIVSFLLITGGIERVVLHRPIDAPVAS